MYEMPAGQLCQAKDEYGLVPTDKPNVKAWGIVSRGCDHPAAMMWSEGVMGMVHGAFSWWCECHALDEQIRHAEERIKALDEMKAKRVDACSAVALTVAGETHRTNEEKE